jgi:hypothetical protein
LNFFFSPIKIYKAYFPFSFAIQKTLASYAEKKTVWLLFYFYLNF